MRLECASPESVNMDPAVLEKIEGITLKAIDEGILTGMNIAVARHGKLVFNESYGKLNRTEDSPPIPRDAIYPIFSISKPITATLIMMLYDQGLLDINDPVQKYIPEFIGEGKDKVKIHHLLTHTTGMNSEDMYTYFNENKEKFEIPAVIPAYLKCSKHPKRCIRWLLSMEAPLTKPTGKEMSYCNIGYDMLGFIVTIVTGRSLNSFAKKVLFKPLGMADTSYVKTAKQIAGRVVERKPSPNEKISWMNTLGCFTRSTSGCGGVSSTAQDLAIFGQMFLNKGEYDGQRILSQRSVELMATNQIPGVPAVWGNETFQEAAWSYGFNTVGVQDNFPTNKAYYHGGYAGARLFIDPILDIVIVFFKALREENMGDFPGVPETVAEACRDYEELKTQPLH